MNEETAQQAAGIPVNDTPEKYATLIARAKAAGDLPENLLADFEHHREFVSARRFTISFDPGYHVLGEFRAQDAVLQALGQRRWLLLEAPAGSPGFVTTDRPVTLMHADGSPGSTDRPLSYETRNTMVFFPLAPTLLAYGSYELPTGVHQVGRRAVAKANVLMAQHRVRQIFAPHDRFELAVSRDKYLVGAQVFEIVRRATRTEVKRLLGCACAGMDNPLKAVTFPRDGRHSRRGCSHQIFRPLLQRPPRHASPAGASA